MTLLNKRIAYVVFGLLVVVSLFFRLKGIAHNEFFFYDEGYYYTLQRAFDELIIKQPARSVIGYLTYLNYNFHISLCSDKPVWFFLLHLRSFSGSFDALYFSRIFSAVAGILTLVMTYFFALRYFKSSTIAMLSTAILALLPAHVFYSRLGLQEALSALFLLTGFFCYFRPGRFGWRCAVSGVFFALSYFTNYRMFIIPGLVLVSELFTGLADKQLNWRRYIWSMTVFAVLAVVVGVYYDACHLNFVVHWMLRQAGLAEDHFDFFTFLSYPYMIFRLESFIFGAFLFSNILLMKKYWKDTLPFVLVILQMLIFSFAYEKGARYLAVVIPFMAMAVAVAIYRWYHLASSKILKNLVLLAAVCMLIQHLGRVITIQTFSSDYREAVEDILRTDPGAKILSTQAYIQNLFTRSRETVEEPPHEFIQTVAYQQKGYDYLVIDPQAYISYTKSKERFDPPLDDHLEFLSSIPPLRVYDHFSDAMLERFVFEHNVYLSDSIKFLKENKDKRFNKLRVYKTKDYVSEVLRRLEHRNQLKSQPKG